MNLPLRPEAEGGAAIKLSAEALAEAQGRASDPDISVVRPASVRTVVLVALSFLTLIGPFLAAPLPPMTDFPNHLARYWLIAGGQHDPALAPFYRIVWSNAVTNIGVDRMIDLLSPFISGLTLGHAAAILAAVLPPLGVLALNVAAHRRLTTWQALFPVATWSATLLMGFLNFQIGLGLALCFAALDPLAHPGWPKTLALARIPFALVLATDHLFGLIFYAVLLAGLGFGAEPLGRFEPRTLLDRTMKAARAAVWCVAPLAVLSLHRRSLPGAQEGSGDINHAIQYNVMPGKLATLVSPLASYNLAQELVMASALTALVVWLCRRRLLTAHAGLAVAAAGLVVLAMLAPSRAAGASWVDRRFPIMALLCLLAALQVRVGIARPVRFSLGVWALALAALQSAWVGWNWRATVRDLDSVERVLAHVEAGARVIPVQHDPSLAQKWRAPAGRYVFAVGDPTFRHFDAVAVPLRRAFVPNLFAARGLQPLTVLGEWDGLVEHNGGDLASIAALGRAPRPDEPSYLKNWRRHFDYVLVLNADMPDQSGEIRPPRDLTLVAATRFAQLWKVPAPRRTAPG